VKIKALFSTFIVSLFMLVGASAQAQPFDSYINAQAAMSDVDRFDNGVSAVVTYGHRVPEVAKRFSVEGEFTTSIVEPEGFGVDVSYWSMGAYAAYTPSISTNLNLRGRIGIVFINYDFGGFGGRGSDDDVELSVGFGMTGKLSKTWNWMVEYTMITDEINHISAGLQFKI